MYTSSISDLVPKYRSAAKEQKTFLKKLRLLLGQEVHLKIENDDVPINYTLKEVAKDHIVVLFAHIQRTIPIDRILYIQTETSTPAPSSPI